MLEELANSMQVPTSVRLALNQLDAFETTGLQDLEAFMLKTFPEVHVL